MPPGVAVDVEDIAREFENIRLRSEDVAEFAYSPTACTKTYRIVVVRKNLSIEKGARCLFDDIRYFFYITNDQKTSAAEIVLEANARCNQENLIAQLHGAHATRMPVDTLLSNWAYMVMASLAWTLKAWSALLLPERGRSRESTGKRSWRCCGWNSGPSSTPYAGARSGGANGPAHRVPIPVVESLAARVPTWRGAARRAATELNRESLKPG